ncbi:hypothetical protein BKA62DRAFT_770217 [Auriculariales sp. MPI-PUGE-AT-0066]|nr:hypothetical protein BKA62DRAFT_770217 [Auriculariales sp. MPI-PUGE-AT-0066]
MFKIIVLTQTLFGLSLAANDWSKACLDGTCSYEGGDGTDLAYSTLDLKASAATLSDITPAAGWTISGCASDWAVGVANIQLKCEGTAQQTANCNHLFEGGAATNKVVRLTEECGIGAFARVVNATETAANAYDVALDYEFSQIPSTSGQSLSFSISSSNVKDAGSTARVRRSMQKRRYPVPFTRRLDFDQTIQAPPIRFDRNFNLVNQSFECKAGNVDLAGTLQLDADLAVHIMSAFSLKVSGDVLPIPVIKEFALTATAHGQAGATFTAQAAITGEFSTGDFKLFEAGLPGANFPGILNLGPRFILNSRLDANLGLQVGAKLGATYQLPMVTLVFPESAGKSSAHVQPIADALALELESQVTATADVTAHLIPRLEFGLDFLGGLVKADVFLNVDGSLGLNANATASAVAASGKPVDTSVNACVSLDAAVAVTAGAEGGLPGIFEDKVDFNIFSKEFNLFQRCIGDVAKRSYRVPPSLKTDLEPSETSHLSRRAIACPNLGNEGVLTGVLNLARKVTA